MANRVSQITGQVLAAPTGANARVSQVTGQVMAVPTSANARVSQVTAQVWATIVNPQHAIAGYLKDQLITHLFRTASFAKVTTGLWIALYTVVPTDVTLWTEVTGGSYARAMILPRDDNWSAPVSGDGTTHNLVDVLFPTPTADWGTILGYAILDAPTGGNMLFFSTLTTVQAVTVGSNPRFLATKLTATLD